MAPHDAEAGTVVAGVLAEVAASFRRRAGAGQRDGTVAAGQAPADVARLLLRVHPGLRVLARSRPEPALPEGLLRPVAAMLGSEAGSRPGAGATRLAPEAIRAPRSGA